MAEFTFPQTAGAVPTAPTNALTLTAPSAVALTNLPSALALRVYDGLPLSIAEVQSIRGLAVANGREPIRLIVKGVVLDCGLLAPGNTISAAVSGSARATATLECGTANVGANDQILVGVLSGSRVVRFVSSLTLTAGLGYDQVLIGANIDATLENLRLLINGEPGHGSAYYNQFTALGFDGTFSGIECPSAVNTTDHSLLFRAIAYGTAGNSLAASIVTDTANGLETFGTGGFLTGGTNATAGQPEAGTYRYVQQYHRDEDGALSGAGEATIYSHSQDANVALTGMTASADATVGYTRALRTTDLGTEFWFAKSIARSGTTATDDVSDAELVTLTDAPYEPNNFRTYAEGFPPKVAHIAMWNGALWGAGAVLSAEYARGTIAVTHGGTTVTFTGAVLSQMMVGRTFQVTATAEKYLILKVDMSVPAAPVVTIERPYEGITIASGGTYAIRDERDPCAIYCSISGAINQWPFDFNPGRADTDDPEGVTGILPIRNVLYVSTPTSITEVTGDNIENWVVRKAVDGVGWVASRLVVATDMGLIFLSRSGICNWTGGGEPKIVSSPATKKGQSAIGIEDTIARISWANVRQGFATYNKELRQVRFAVPLDGAEVPSHEIVLDLQNNTWALFRRPAFTASCPVVLPGGGQAWLYGDRDGLIWHGDVGESDGAYAFQPLQTLTGAQTVRTLTTNGTALPTSGDGLKGVPVLVLYADGSTVAVAKIASNTSAAVTLAEDLTTAPAASDQIVVGGIWWRAKTGYYGKNEDFDRKQFRDTTISHIPVSSGTYEYAYAIEGGAFTLCSVGYTQGDLTASNGRRRFRPQTRAMNKADLIQGFLPGPAPTIRSVVNSIGIRERSSA